LKPHLQAMNGNLSLEQRYLAVKSRIARAAQAAGRDPDSVRLLAVGKTFPAASLRALAMAGQRAFGENYLQEALGKIAALSRLRPDGAADDGAADDGAADDGTADDRPDQLAVRPGSCALEWHFIGPIQSNKTRKIAESFDWVQSVEEERIARRLSEQRPLHLPPLDICLQVNVSGEASKSGCDPDDVVALAQAVARLPNLRLRGLMAIPEPTDDASLQLRRFGQVRELFGRVGAGLQAAGTGESGDLAFDTLSMGMSADLEAAIAQGATIVRIGSALFGERPRPRSAL
jgi:pyridoxal phosphate enzyme (YggS family)